MKLNITSLNQIVNNTASWKQAANWTIEDYIPEQSFGCLVAPSNSYKSFQAVDFACSIATGQPWNGKEVKQGRVLYMAGEGQAGVSKRVDAWDAATGLNASAEVAVYGNYIDLLDNELVNDIIKLLKVEQVELVIFDTLARCFSGEENSAKDISRFVAACDRIKQECKCSILVVHHTGKDTSKGARGSSALYAAMDYELVMERKGNLQYVLRVDKQKDAEEQEPSTHNLQVVELGSDSKGKIVSSLAPIFNGAIQKAAVTKATVKNQAEEMVKAALSTPKTREELNLHLATLSPANKSKTLKAMEENGVITITKDKTNKKKDVFNLIGSKPQSLMSRFKEANRDILHLTVQQADDLSLMPQMAQLIQDKYSNYMH
ncbi:AAA family ATPase [Enterovibrio calviensis]|uniref:AAA family ATPase n=1 Tax=Enterovibrio calviensis TaxID=91359 RepID=UPI000684705D|nr:helicase RepA family protein [Enterovibrio calviensis]